MQRDRGQIYASPPSWKDLLPRSRVAQALPGVMTVAISAVLLFLVQPIIAKQILPWFGGSASVWTTCMVFFQVVLFLGYLYAHLLTTKCSSRSQWAIHSGLLLLSLLSLPMSAHLFLLPSPAAQVLLILTAGVGLPYFTLASTGPLMQTWLAARSPESKRPRVYRLFALSNLGSLIGLLSYPFLVEPRLALDQQRLGWSAFFVGFVFCCLITIGLLSQQPVFLRAEPRTAGMRPPLATVMLWAGCAALGSMTLLAVTNHITQNVAAVPFLWIAPLVAYLLSFMLVFDVRGRAGSTGWYHRGVCLTMAMVSAVAMAILVTHPVLAGLRTTIGVFNIGLFFITLFVHGELAAARPDARFLTSFYLSLSAGGAVGGLLIGIGAPLLFNAFWELPILLICVTGLGTAVAVRRWSYRGALLSAFVLVALSAWYTDDLPLQIARLVPGGKASVFLDAAISFAVLGLMLYRQLYVGLTTAALTCALLYGALYVRDLHRDTDLMERNFYGAQRVDVLGVKEHQVRRMWHGTTIHGEQFQDPSRSMVPTTYYGHSSGVGQLISAMQETYPSMRVGLIGLGAGTLAAYARDDDHYLFYELDPAVIEIARSRFTFLSPKIETVLGDGRLSLEQRLEGPEQPRFDLLVVDAFSGDSIPVHLISAEALKLYMQVIQEDGVVAFHLTNLYLDLPPIVGAWAKHAGFDARLVRDPGNVTDLTLASDWVVLTRNHAVIAQFGNKAAVIPSDGPLWTDASNNLYRALK